VAQPNHRVRSLSRVDAAQAGKLCHGLIDLEREEEQLDDVVRYYRADLKVDKMEKKKKKQKAEEEREKDKNKEREDRGRDIREGEGMAKPSYEQQCMAKSIKIDW